MDAKPKITAEGALKIIGYVRDFYRQSGLGEIGEIDLHVLHADEMEIIFGEGVTGNACSNHTIIIKRESTPSEFAEVFAHEILHLWQFEHNLYNLDIKVCEGFCNLGAYLFLEQIGTPGARRCMQQLLDNPDPVYGDGFRMMLDVFRRKGWEGAIQVLKQLN